MPKDEEIPTALIAASDRKSRLDYIAELLDEIRKMALMLDEESLAYLVEVSMLEARLQAGLCKEQSEAGKHTDLISE